MQVSSLTSSSLLHTRKHVIIVLRLIVFSILYLIAFQEHTLTELPWLLWGILAIFFVSELVYLFEHRASFFVQRVLGWVFLFDALLISLVIYLLDVKSLTLFIAYFAVIAIAAMAKSVAAAFVITLLVSVFYLFIAWGQEGFVLNEFITRPLFFFGIALFSGYLTEEINKEKKRGEQESDKTHTELKRTQAGLIQAEKLATLGQFSAGIAHELKNPLGIIMGGMEFLDAKLTNADIATKTAFGKIKESALKANEIIANLLKFAKPAELKFEMVRLNDLLNETLFLLKYRRTLVANITIKTELSPKEISVWAIRNQLQQVFFNILINSLEAITQGGEIKIKTSREGANSCVIEFRDTGEGISKDNLARVLEPFFTTKRDKGTGLGLSMAKVIIDDHRGKLIIDSQPGQGTLVKVILPFLESLSEKRT